MRFLILVAGVGVMGLISAACGGDDDSPAMGGMDMGGAGTPTAGAAKTAAGAAESSVTVNLKNWSIEPSSATLAAGTVKFTATHEAEHGGMAMAGQEGATHQLVVLPLPQGAKAGQSKFGAPVLNLSDIKPGETKTGQAALAPGTYELACLVVEQVDGKAVNHYEKGMFAQVTVK
ncbi:MAG: hypothetical protein C0506_08295 [Anaerolinea sp.]|nr:hypothetical protein [Anaerolinea sp.]